MRLKSRLSDLMEPNFGLLDQLLSLGVLTRSQYDDIYTGHQVTKERNDALLDVLTSDEQCVKFLEALNRTGQHHVVNFVTQTEVRQLMQYDVLW